MMVLLNFRLSIRFAVRSLGLLVRYSVAAYFHQTFDGWGSEEDTSFKFELRHSPKLLRDSLRSEND